VLKAVGSRRRFAQWAAFGAAAIAAPALLAQTRPEKPRIGIAVNGKSSFFYLPLTIADQLGYFKDEGLEVEVADHAVAGRAVQAVLSGTADVVSGNFEHTIHLQGKNQFFQSFVLQGRAPQIALGISTRAMPAYRGAADLRGRRIGVSAPGSTTHMVASMALARAGIRGGDVSYVAVGSSGSAMAALRSGQVDALSNSDPVMTMLEQKGEVRIISDTRTLKGTAEVFGGPMPAGCLFATVEFVQKHPATCQALANAIVHSLKWLQTAGPSDIIKTVPETYLLGDRALYLASFNKMREAISLDGILSEEGARTAVRAMAAFEPGLQAERIAVSRTYTNEFARRAKDRFRL
jgi:NitT/TauT family transport system substrate-binding protein